MKYQTTLLFIVLAAIAVQCKQDSLSLAPNVAGVTTPSSFFTGSYELVSYTRETDFGQVLTQDDFDSVTGSLLLTQVTVKQEVTIDEETTTLEGVYTQSVDDDAIPPAGTVIFPNEMGVSILHGDYVVDGVDLVINLQKTTDLGVDYVETIRWHKVSDFPQE